MGKGEIGVLCTKFMLIYILVMSLLAYAMYILSKF